MTKEKESILFDAIIEKLAKNLLYGEKGIPEIESDLNVPAPIITSTLQRKLKGTMVCCYVCGDAHTMLYKDDVGYICKMCRRKKNNMRSLSKGEGK